MGWLMSQHVKPLAEELGMQRIHWHALRHLNDSLMMNEGVDVATRMDRLGHVTDRVNLIYSHSGDEAQLAASEAIERRLEAARDTLEKGRRAGFQALSPLLTVTQTVTSALGCLVQDIDNMEPAKGIEPPTYGLRNRCSTPELRRHGADKNAHPTNAATTPNSWVSILRGE